MSLQKGNTQGQGNQELNLNQKLQVSISEQNQQRVKLQRQQGLKKLLNQEQLRVKYAGNISLPIGFDWKVYLLYNPDLKEMGIDTENRLIHHYLKSGRLEGRVYKRLRVLLRYTACTGLINQIYSHIASIALAGVLGAELVLPSATQRDSFANYFSVDDTRNEVKWTSAPLQGLVDTDNLIKSWKQKELTIYMPPQDDPFPDLTKPDIAFPQYKMPNYDDKFHIKLFGVYLKNLPLHVLIEMCRNTVIGHAQYLLKEDPELRLETVILDLPCTFFCLRTNENIQYVQEIAKSIKFAPLMHQLANRVIEGIAALNNGINNYNGIHLRIENDARDWIQLLGGPQMVWNKYVQGMINCHFDQQTDLYVANGLLSYDSKEQFRDTANSVISMGLAKRIFHKELFLAPEDLKGLNSEQRALIDFLVLSQSKGFVGMGSSTFSFYIREYRALNGIPRTSSFLLDTSVIGTEELFKTAGTVAF